MRDEVWLVAGHVRHGSRVDDLLFLCRPVAQCRSQEVDIQHVHRIALLCLHLYLLQLARPVVDVDDTHPFAVVTLHFHRAFPVGREFHLHLVVPLVYDVVSVGHLALEEREFVLVSGIVRVVVPIDVYGVLRIYLAAAHARIVADDVLVQASRYMKEAWALRLQGEGYAKGDEEEEFSHAGTVCFGGFLRLPPFAPCPRCGGSYRQAAAQERQNLLTKERVLAAKLPLFEDKPGKRQKKWSLFLHNQKLCRTFAVLLKTKPSNMVPIVQLVRASDCGSECRRFESDWAP